MKTRKRRTDSDMDSLTKFGRRTPDVGPVPHDGTVDLGKNGKIYLTESNYFDFRELDFYPHNDVYSIREVNKL